MKEANSLNSVAEFHRTFKHPILPAPTIPSEERCKLRVSLIAEELKELEQAIQDNNIVEIADALSDLQYVLSGAILEFGLAEKFGALFSEVHRSNMSKACATAEEAEKTIDFYKNKDNTNAYFVESDGKFLVYRKEDNKTLKSVNYSPAELEKIVKG
ncbi:MAG TPA: nucleoside triphosphate pyrophosphohydrolase family protein [Cytophagaceae bacterium]|nr:nucleoside triphosphate pyrophosphohydrolase family protein [Cytophagaceae bacterium]